MFSSSASSVSGYNISNSVRLRSSASAYFSRTFGSGSRTTWTWSGWVKRGAVGALYPATNYGQTLFGLNDSDKIWFYEDGLKLYLGTGATYASNPSDKFRDPSAWYHIVVVLDTTNATSADRIRMYVNNRRLTISDTMPSLNYASSNFNSAIAHNIGRADNSNNYYFDGYITEVNFIDGQALTPSSFGENDNDTGVWKPKKYAGTYGTNGFYLPFSDNSSTTALGKDAAAASGSATSSVYNALGTDGTGWQGYGVRQLIPSSAIQFSGLGTKVRLTVKAGSQGAVLTAMKIGKRASSGNAWDFDGNQVSVTFSGSTSLTLGANASATSDWITFPLTSASDLICATIFSTGGPYGLARDEGVSGYTNYAKASGTDGVDTAPSGYSGTAGRVGLFQRIEIDGNHWTPNNISLTAGATYDSMIDTPTMYADGGNGRGNYPVMNPLGLYGSISLVDGNLKGSSSSSNVRAYSSIVIPSTGKWYLEFTEGSSGYQGDFGLLDYTYILANPSSISYSNGATIYSGYYFARASATAYTGGGSVSDGTSLGFAVQGVKGLAIDMDAGRVYFIPNSSGFTNSAYLSIDTTKQWVVGGHRTTTFTGVPFDFIVNFGQRPFTYTPPSGFKALNTQNLPDSTIKKGSTSFDVQTWSGDSVNGRTITSTVDTVDFAWVKKRNGIDDHRLANTVTGGNKHLKSDTTDPEGTGTTIIQAFSGNTFTVGSDGSVNASGGTYVGWLWKANGAGSSNTSGTITSTVSVNTTAGFSVVTYTGNSTSGATVGHGLGVAPSMVIVKNRDATYSWMVKTSSLASTYNLRLQDAGGASPAFGSGYVDGLTSTVFTLYSGSSDIRNVNGNTERYVAYCWAEVPGFSKFGSYTGNLSTDGPFVYCGFKPRYLLIKNSSISASWEIIDTSRDTYNVAYHDLYAESPNDESTGTNRLDILSNGFKIRDNNTFLNGSTNTVIFAAFAENPFKYALAR